MNILESTCACMLEPGRSHGGRRRGDIARWTVCESRHWCGRRDQIPSLMPHLSLAGRGCPSRLFSRHHLRLLTPLVSARRTTPLARGTNWHRNGQPALLVLSNPRLGSVATHSAEPERPRARPRQTRSSRCFSSTFLVTETIARPARHAAPSRTIVFFVRHVTNIRTSCTV